MAQTEELKKIKKKYGENFMQMCRKLFPTILEKEGRLYEILNSSFGGNSRTLYEDIVSENLEEKFKDFIYGKIEKEEGKKYKEEIKTPYELLDEVGYNLIECTSENEIQEFKKYYAKGEELCTFKGGRLARCVVFFAVKKNVDEIKRENFTEPQREDEYGTSVMSIQFNKEGRCTVSIKNRYNHKVNNPDATYGNDLEKIIPGLTKSFKELLLNDKKLELNKGIEEKFNIPGYVETSDGKYYKYNIEIDGIYYCPGNIVIKDGKAEKIGSPEKQLLIDNFVLDIENKELKDYDPKNIDGFIDEHANIEKIEITKDKEKNDGTKKIILTKKDCKEPIIIEIDKDNKIIGYINHNLIYARDNFLCKNVSLQKLELPKLKEIGKNFLYRNLAIEKIDLPELKEIGSCFCFFNKSINQINIPKVEKIGQGFLLLNKKLKSIKFPLLREIESEFLYENEILEEVELPNVEKVGENFLKNNRELEKLELPKLKKAGKSFLFFNEKLKKLKLPNLEIAEDNFLYCNLELEEVEFPKLNEVENNFLHHNEKISRISMPNLSIAGKCLLCCNKALDNLELQNLEKIGADFLYKNEVLSEIQLPNVKEIGSNFLYHNKGIKELELSKTSKIGYNFLYENSNLTKINLSSLTEIPHDFNSIFRKKQDIVEMDLPLEFKEILDQIINNNIKNKEKREKINHKDISMLDKASNLLTSTIEWAKGIFAKIMQKEEKNVDKKDRE